MYYFRTVTELDQIPQQLFCSRSRIHIIIIIVSRKCPTSVCRWDVLKTFIMGRATSTITQKSCYFRTVIKELDQIPYQFLRSLCILLKYMEVGCIDVLTTFLCRATSATTVLFWDRNGAGSISTPSFLL